MQCQMLLDNFRIQATINTGSFDEAMICYKDLKQARDRMVRLDLTFVHFYRRKQIMKISTGR